MIWKKFVAFIKCPVGLCVLCLILAIASFCIFSSLIHDQEEESKIASMLIPDRYSDFVQKYPKQSLTIARSLSYDIAVANYKIDIYSKIRMGCLIVFCTCALFFGAVTYLERRKQIREKE